MRSTAKNMNEREVSTDTVRSTAAVIESVRKRFQKINRRGNLHEENFICR